MEKTMHQVFVYGTLKKGEGNHHILRGSQFVAPDSVRGYLLYSLGGFPGASPTIPTGNSLVCGEVYSVDDETLKMMDRLEGHPNWYRREMVILESKRRAWMYVYLCSLEGRPIIQSGIWCRHQQSPTYQSVAARMDSAA